MALDGSVNCYWILKDVHFISFRINLFLIKNFMHNNNLLKLLKSFQKEEFRDFCMFVSSQYFNRENVLITFTGILKKHYPTFTGNDLLKDKIYLKLFPGKKYNDAVLRNAVSDLLKLAEEFLKTVQLKKDPFYGQYLLLKELTNRKQQKLFNMNYKKAEHILKDTGIADEIYYQNVFLLSDEKRRNVVVNSSRILYKDDNLNEQAYNLHLHYLVENVKLYAIMLNQRKFTYDHEFDFSLFEILLKYIEDNFEFYKKIPYISIFYNCVMLYKTEEKKYFNEMKYLTKTHFNKLTLTDRKNMYMVLSNHSTSQIKSGKFEFYEEMFDIYLEMIRSKAYLEGNNFMAHYIYISIAMNAVALGNLDWSEKFLNKYKKLLHSDFMDSSYNYCMANVHLEKKEFNSALEKLSRVRPIDINFKIYINTTLLKIYFCKNESDSFLSLVDSFRHFIRRNKEMRLMDRTSHNNFLLYLKKLFILKSGHNIIHYSDFMILKSSLEKNNETSYKKWLLDEFSKFENNFL